MRNRRSVFFLIILHSSIHFWPQEQDIKKHLKNNHWRIIEKYKLIVICPRPPHKMGMSRTRFIWNSRNVKRWRYLDRVWILYWRVSLFQFRYFGVSWWCIETLFFKLLLIWLIKTNSNVRIFFLYNCMMSTKADADIKMIIILNCQLNHFQRKK